MKILVAYFSQTGNTKQIAEAIYEASSFRHEVDMTVVRKVDHESLQQYDLLFVGAPCHDSDLAIPVKNFLEGLPDSPTFKVAGFFTHATYPRDRNERARELYDRWAGRCHLTFENTCKDKNMEYLGYFNCQGKANAAIEHFIHQEIILDEDEWNEYLPDLRTHPTKYDVECAKKFASQLLDEL